MYILKSIFQYNINSVFDFYSDSTVITRIHACYINALTSLRSRAGSCSSSTAAENFYSIILLTIILFQENEVNSYVLDCVTAPEFHRSRPGDGLEEINHHLYFTLVSFSCEIICIMCDKKKKKAFKITCV